MKKHIVLLYLIFQCWTNLYPQNNIPIINGFSKYIAGEEGEEDCSCTTDATTAMLIRCLNDKDYIEWETDQVPDNYNGKMVSFVWSGGYSTGTKDEGRTFSLYVNSKILFSFVTASRIEGGDWKISNENAELSFKNRKFYNRSGNTTKDFWGFFILTVPASELNRNRTLKIKVKGDATGSRHWFRAMEYQLLSKVEIVCEKIVTKESYGRNAQTVKVSIDHFTNPEKVQISSDNKKLVDDELKLGRNDFFIKFDAVKTAVQKSVEVKISGNVEKYSVTIQPVKTMIFYLLSHSHVDIGYTDLQTEIEKKQWDNIDQAIQLSEKTSAYQSDASFKWNTEVLWAVKSYLENFPEKKIFFIDAVKKGWIGLDANYANLLTGLCRPEELYRLVDYSNELEKITGVKIESAMISDVPGYTWGISQVFADNGIKYFSVGTNESTRIGNSLKTWGDKPFYWETPSGKNKILVWLAGKGYSWFHHWDLLKDDYSRLVKYLDELESTNYPYGIVQLRYTIGDNGGPNPDLADFVKEWNESHVTPQFKLSTTLEMFKDFENKYADSIPTYKGDFTPYWEDGAGSSAKETSINRNTAEKLNQLEILYSLIDSKNYPYKEFDDAWKNVLLYSEHTWGSYKSITSPEDIEVKEQWEVKKSFALKADSIAQKLLANLSYENQTSSKKAESFSVYNTSSWKRTDVVFIPANIIMNENNLIDDKGNEIETQQLKTGEIVFIAKDIPAFGSKKYSLGKKAGKKAIDYNSKEPKINSLSNKFYDIAVDSQTGTFELIYKNVNGNSDEDAEAYKYLNRFVHTGRNAVDSSSNSNVKVSIKENGPVLKSLLITSEAPGCNKLTSEIIIFNELKKIEVINTIDKKNIYDKEDIRFVFPFDINDPHTRIDLAWSVIEPEKDQLSGANKNYFTAQRWIDVSGNNRGITLASIDAPIFEIGGMNGEKWISGTEEKWSTEAHASSLIYSWVMNNSWHTNYNASQAGITSFKYYLKPHKEFDYLQTYKFGVEQSQPMLVLFTNKQMNRTLLDWDDNENIVVTSLEVARDGKSRIVKLYNPTTEVAHSILRLNNGCKIYNSNCDKENITEIKGNIELKPFEVKIIKITF